jgi:hypothetical protein
MEAGGGTEARLVLLDAAAMGLAEGPLGRLVGVAEMVGLVVAERDFPTL